MVRTNRTLKTKLPFGFVCLFIFLSISVYTYAAADQKHLTVDNVVEKWLAVASLQYDRGLYDDAQNSLTRALQYRVHLRTEQIELIENLIEQAENAKTSKSLSADKITEADNLAQQGKLLEAKASVSEILKQKNLADTDRKRAVEFNKHLDIMINEQKKQMAKLYAQSEKQFKSGQLEQARQGFVKVAQSGLYKPLFGDSAEKYLEKIQLKYEQKPSHQGKSPAKIQVWPWVREEEKPAPKTDEKSLPPAAVIEPNLIESDAQAQIPVVTDTADEPEIANRGVDLTPVENNIKLNYIKAVVADAQDRANRYSGRSEFKQAISAIENASMTLEKYRNDLRAETYSLYKNKLEDLKIKVLEQKRDWQNRWDTQNSEN